MGERRGVYRVLVGKPEGKRPHGINRSRWDGDIKVDLQEVGWEAWAEIIWLRIWTADGHLEMRQ